jgi:hypothetical protein
MKHSAIIRIISIAVTFMALGSACTTTSQYAEKLQNGATYGMVTPSETADKIVFTYQSMDHADLTALRNTLRLETIAGDGPESEQIIRLMQFVHQLVPWDGSAPWPQGTLHTINILNHSKETNQGVNCRMMSIILQEVYLAMGFPARIVGCLPLDPNDNDSHVITTVWAADLGKWLWMDPSFNTYVMDKYNNPMSIEEVREGLIAGRQFKLSEGANVRGNRIKESFYFDYYMTKNLYAMVTPLEARYGYEGSPGQRFVVMLVPAIEYPENPQDCIQQYSFRESIFTRYIISDPRLFWQPFR